MLRRVPPLHGRAGYWSWLRIALVVVAVATASSAQLLGQHLDDGSDAAILAVSYAAEGR
jgi:hypothetical protein